MNLDEWSHPLTDAERDMIAGDDYSRRLEQRRLYRELDKGLGCNYPVWVTTGITRKSKRVAHEHT